MADIVRFKTTTPETTILKFAISDGHPAIVENVEWTWAQLVKRLSRSDRDSFTIAEFRSLTEDQQLRRKNNGYFVGAQFLGNRRKKVNMQDRCLLTFDIDDCSEQILADLELGTSGLGDIEYVVYSTRKHVFPNNIRLRIVMPLAQPLTHDKFQAVSRILAASLDPTMKTVDRVSFSDAQFMYWPSHCADVKPFFLHNRGKNGAMVDPEKVLETFGPDWKDFTKLPRTSRESEKRRPVEKMQNPLEKHGIVGAFCRHFNVHQAIDEFLSDVYKPSAPDRSRYTYIPGTTSNGCVVYDSGNAFFSHHGTDPAGDRSNNSFDLVRIHRFADLDDKADPNLAPQFMPSFRAMQTLALEYDDVKKDFTGDEYTEEDLDDILPPVDEDNEYAPEEDPEATSDLNLDTETTGDKVRKTLTEKEAAADPNLWKLDLDLTSEGQIKPGVNNIVLILRNAKAFKGRFGFDEFQAQDVVRKPIISRKLHLQMPGPTAADPLGRLNQHHLTATRMILEAPRKKGGWGVFVTDRDLLAAHALVSQENPFHPVREYLGGLTWDGVKRMEKLWTKACHAAESPYHRETARLWLTAAVARIYEPGCKFDFCPIIEGPQGLLKSTLLNVLGGNWTTELSPHFDQPQRLVESTLGYWIVEIPELAQFGRAEVTQIKALITEQASKGVRMAYAKLPSYFPRQFIFAGTTNDDQYLRDQTGNRRFWPIKCGPGQIDIAWVEANRNQIWAEAVESYRAMRKAKPTGHLPLYLTGRAVEEATSEQAGRVVDDGSESAAGVIEVWLNRPVPAGQAQPGAEPGDFTDDAETQELVLRMITCGREIHERALGGKPKEFQRGDALFVKRAMTHIKGWMLGKHMRCGSYGLQRAYIRTEQPEVTSGDDDL